MYQTLDERLQSRSSKRTFNKEEEEQQQIRHWKGRGIALDQRLDWSGTWLYPKGGILEMAF